MTTDTAIQQPAAAPAAATGTPDPAPATETGNPAPQPGAEAGKPAAEGKSEPPKPAWGDDWRDKASAGDPDLKKRLDRYTDPTAMAKALAEAQNKIKAGEAKAPLAKDATPEQKAAWRKENGLPENAADYLKNVPKELKGAIDAHIDPKVAEPFLNVMQEANVPPAQAHKLMALYGDMQKKAETEIQNNDVALRDKTDNELRTEWGGDYANNMRARNDLIESFPTEVQELFKNARLGNGEALMNNKVMAQELAQIGRFMFPKGITAPGSMSDDLKTIDGQIAGYEKQIKEDRKGWNANTEGQKHYMQLIEMKGRATGK